MIGNDLVYRKYPRYDYMLKESTREFHVTLRQLVQRNSYPLGLSFR